MKMKFICVIVAFMVVTVPYTEAFHNCGQVVSYLVPCTKYLKSGGVVTASCCDSLKGLKSVAKTIAEMKLACDCINNHYSSVPSINPGYAVTLPGKCGVDVPYVDPNTDCDNDLTSMGKMRFMLKANGIRNLEQWSKIYNYHCRVEQDLHETLNGKLVHEEHLEILY
ncbi:non-specific lipid-transfer protein-like protein [Tanacetum coccineum]